MYLYYFIATLLLGAVTFALRMRSRGFVALVAFNLIQVCFTVYEYSHLDEADSEYFAIDALGFLYLSVLTVVGVCASVYMYLYTAARHESKRQVAMFNASFMLFICCMTGTLAASHMGVQWALLEATSLGAAILIYHNRTANTLEAAWKYVFVSSIGIALAFGALLFISIAAPSVAGDSHLRYETLRQIAPSMDSDWLKISFIFALVGLSVKLGVFPLYTVDIDAKDQSPSPIGALFSAGLMNVGFITLMRFYTAFAGTSIRPWMNHVLLLTGLISLLVAALYLIKVKSYKRLLAYSSVEHAGLALIFVSVGGYYAAVLHLVLHSLVKAGLFLQAGPLIRTYGSRDLADMRGYWALSPAGGLVLLLGLLSVTAVPPSGLFVTELMGLGAIAGQGNWILLSIVLILLVAAFYGTARALLLVVYQAPTPHIPLGKYDAVDAPRAWESWAPLALMLMAMVLALAMPQPLSELINKAVLLFQ